jgi:hypothetical protein
VIILLALGLGQYPGEVEYLWVPCSFLQQSGPRYLEVTSAGAVVLVPVRINSNLKTMTVEEFLGQKKQMHVSAFRHLACDELPHDLRRIAEEGKAAERLEVDLCKERDGRVYNVDDLIHAIVEDVKKTFRLHEALDHERCEPMDPSTSSMKSVTVCCRYAYLIPRFSADGIANKIVPRNERVLREVTLPAAGSQLHERRCVSGARDGAAGGQGHGCFEAAAVARGPLP